MFAKIHFFRLLLLVTWYETEMNLRVCKQLTLVEHVVIRAWKWFSVGFRFSVGSESSRYSKSYS